MSRMHLNGIHFTKAICFHHRLNATSLFFSVSHVFRHIINPSHIYLYLLLIFIILICFIRLLAYHAFSQEVLAEKDGKQGQHLVYYEI